jgi:hypothetical protein
VTVRNATRPAVRVLVEDQALARFVDAERRTTAERSCLATGMVLQRGRWNAGRYAADATGGFGLLILSGLIPRASAWALPSATTRSESQAARIAGVASPEAVAMDRLSAHCASGLL